MNVERKRRIALLAALLMGLAASACSDGEDTPAQEGDLADSGSKVDGGDQTDDDAALGHDASTVADAAEALPDAGADAGEEPEPPALPPTALLSSLPNTSAQDYAHNRFALIEAATLEAYVTNWTKQDSAAASAAPNGRPKHLSADAKLIVLQLNAANRAAGESYIPPKVSNKVYSYELDAFRFNETRDTGLVSNSVRYQASGETADSWLARYGIDLSRDFVVFAQGENTAPHGGFFQDLARAVYWLRYWGASIEHLAIVNGTLKQNYTGALASNKLTEGSFDNAGFSVADLRVDNTGLTLPLEDFLKVVDAKLLSTTAIPGFSRQLIIDARPTAQFNRTTNTAAFYDTHPGQFITTGWNSAGAPSHDATGQAKSYVLFEGHVKGAVSFPWAGLLDNAGDNNWKYKDKAALSTLFESAGYAPADKATKVIVSQCRTNFEVQVNGFAALNILGYPTVFFDGSLVEYFSLVSNHPDAALNLKPSEAAYVFRTDTPARSQHYTEGANDEAPETAESDTGVPAYNVSNGTEAADRKLAQAVINRSATTTRKALDADREYKRR